MLVPLVLLFPPEFPSKAPGVLLRDTSAAYWRHGGLHTAQVSLKVQRRNSW